MVTTRPGPSGAAFTAVIVATGGLLLSLALPRAAASLSHGQATAYLQSYYAGREIRRDDLPAVKAELRRAIDLHGSPKYHADLAVVDMLLAHQAGSGSAAGRELLQEAKRALRESLMQAPANPYAWFHLAVVEKKLAGGADAVLRPLSMSILTGRAEKNLLLPRLDLALTYYDLADDYLKGLILEQIRLGWSKKRKDTQALVERRHRQPLLDSALAFGLAGEEASNP